MSLQSRVELHATIQQWIESFMLNNRVSATDMVDAINETMVNLKDKVMLELLIENAQQSQAMAEQNSQPIAENAVVDIPEEGPQDKEE